MRRKGGRVVSSAKEAILLDAEPVVVTGIEPLASVAPTSSISLVSSSSPPGKTAATTALSSINIFSRFQSHGSDFEASWLLLEDDSPAESGRPPISEELLARLKHNQRQIDTHRNAKGGEMRKSQSPGVPAEPAAEDISDGEYLPSTQVASPLPPPPPPPPCSADTAKEPLVVKSLSGKDERGMWGDYLVFSTTSTRKATEAIGVVGGTPPPPLLPGAGAVSSLPDSSHGPSRGSPNNRNPLSSPHNNHTNNNNNNNNNKDMSSISTGPCGSSGAAASAAPRRMVPLWSVARMTTMDGYCSTSPLVALHQEITDLVDYLRPTQAEVSIRRLLEMEVSRLARRLWPGCEPVVYGSLYTQLMLPLSDVDITITSVPIAPEEALMLLAREISQAGLCDAAYPQLVLKTKVPLIKFQHKGSLVDVDISINAGDGKNNSDIVHDLLTRYPEAQPLIVVIKYFLQQRDMAEPYRGGLGSYATTLLVICFLQSHPIYTTRPEERAVSGLGRLLVDFFRFYGLYWNYHQCGVSIEKDRLFFLRDDDERGFASISPPASPRSPTAPPQAWIEDPGNPANNAASSLRHYHIISSLFSHAYYCLTAEGPPLSTTGLSVVSPAASNLMLRPTILSRVIHVDENMVWRRQLIAETYDRLCETQPAYLEEVRQYRRTEDWSMLVAGAWGKSQHSAGCRTVSNGEHRSLAALVAATRLRAATQSPAIAPHTSPESFASGAKQTEKRSRTEKAATGGSNSKRDHNGELSGDENDDNSSSNASSVRRKVRFASKRKSRSH